MKKKLIYILLMLLFVILLSGCKHSIVREAQRITIETGNKILEALQQNDKQRPSSIDAERITIETGNKILAALQQNDKQMLKELFCPYIRETYPQLEEEIDNLYKVMESEIVSYDKPRSIAEEGTSKLGKGLVEKYMVAEIANVKTDSNETYTIRYKYCYVDEERPRYEGLDIISIAEETDSDVDSLEERKYEIEFTEMWRYD